MNRTDATITALFAIGLIQFIWLSVMLHRRRVAGSRIFSSLPPLLAIWVLFWPLYTNATAILLGIGLLTLCLVLAAGIRRPWFATLKSAWSAGTHGLLDATMFTLALGIAALTNLAAPEFGFGIALTLCLGITAADLLDRAGLLRLGMPANPDQTFAGHMVLIVSASLTCGWSLLIFHNLGWSNIIIATTLAGMAASALRALIPTPLDRPVISIAMAATLWAL